jgi:hypothetical protein
LPSQSLSPAHRYCIENRHRNPALLLPRHQASLCFRFLRF